MPDPYSDSDDSEKPESKASDSGTELLPNSFFPDKPEPGKICKIRVEKVYSDQSAVSYVHSDDEDAYDEESPKPNDVMAEIDEMTA